MTFRLTCPVCGKRDVYEFTYGGPERGPRPAEPVPMAGADPDPAPEADSAAAAHSEVPAAAPSAAEAHFRWAQFRMNRPEAREEWWYHAAGCGVWFSTWRNPATNREEPPAGGGDGGGDPT